MILLFIHSSKFSFSLREKAIREPEEPKLSSLEKDNALVVFTTVEKGDDEEIVNRAVDEVLKVYDQVKPSAVIIYPYAHLSDNLESPQRAIQVLSLLEEKLRGKVSEVYRTPFGWYKQFMINCYGHPLSELSKRIRHGEVSFEKSEEMKVCEKFHFPNSPHATFMRRAVIEYLKLISKALYVIEGSTDPEKGEMVVSYQQVYGRRLPCVNEEPHIIVKTWNVEGLQQKFSDSKNEYLIYKQSDKGYYIVDVNLLVYYFMLNASKENPPTLPLWMSPIQVRILPVKKEFLDEAIKIAESLNVRVDVDDTDDGLGAKIARAGKEWIPYVVVLGEREIKTGSLTVKVRVGNQQKSYSKEELEKEILNADRLRLKSNLPLLLSHRGRKEFITLQ